LVTHSRADTDARVCTVHNSDECRTDGNAFERL